jgi:hypothetical protein
MEREKPIRLSSSKPLLQDFSEIELGLLINAFGENDVKIDLEKSKVSYNNTSETSLLNYLNLEKTPVINKYLLYGRCSREYNGKPHEVFFELKLKDNDGIMGRVKMNSEQNTLDQCYNDLTTMITEWYKLCK